MVSCIARTFIFVERVEVMRNAYSILGRKPGRRGQFGRPRHRGGNNIEIDLKEKGYDGVSCIHLDKDRN
jgi:hypothetical protein